MVKKKSAAAHRPTGSRTKRHLPASTKRLNLHESHLQCKQKWQTNGASDDLDGRSTGIANPAIGLHQKLGICGMPWSKLGSSVLIRG
jgi:hypothetical protein